MSLALNFERKCRTCGTDILELTCGIPIFGSGLQLDQKIHRYLGLNIALHDDLPKFLCATCFIKVESIDKFAILAKKTEEAYLGWFKCIRANLAKHISPLPPPLAPVRQLVTTPAGAGSPKPGLSITPKIDFTALKQAVDEQIKQNDAPLGSALNPIRLIKPEISIVSYSDLKLGLLIKDQELLKLILKALRWAEHDQRATFEVLIQRLKNTTFREILSNPNLLKDSDLTQLLKSYIGQEAFNKFTSGNGNATAGSGIDLGNRGVTIKPIVHISPVKANPDHQNSGVASASCSTVLPVVKKERMYSNEEKVTQMEVGVDPSLFLDDEESQGKSKVNDRQKMENVVTIQLVPAKESCKKSEEKMPPLSLSRDIRCTLTSVSPEALCSKSNLESRETSNKVIKPHNPPLLATPTDKKMIKIRVKKNKEKIQPPTLPTPIPINPISLPISIPPTTTITMIPAKPSEAKPLEEKPQPKPISPPPIPALNLQKPTEPPKTQNEKSKRKREVKWTLKLGGNPAKRTRSQVSSTKTSKLSCTVCKKRFPSKSKLTAHMESHPNPKVDKYTCDKCDRVFRTAANLSKHKQFHGGEKFSCDHCRKVYPTSSMLKTHKLSHSDDRPHRCTICDRTFKRNQDLKFHLNQHTGSRPFKCPQCPKTFASSGNCFSHRKRMHPSGITAAEEKEHAHKPPVKVQ
ncbi:hypothetical protein RP20_CCG011020 [Aedes albopictus]|nr:hypothetical protein RP20_CCG011020 [Aedes albopictus]